MAVTAPGLPLSVAHHEGRSIDLGRFLHPGFNRLEFEMESYWGDAELHIYVSPWDGTSVVLVILVLSAVALTGEFFLLLFRIEMTLAESVLLLGGFLLRYLYFSGTPYFVRAYDWWGHEAYLDYVAQHLAVPNAEAGWENFQPPLYYGLLGGLTRLLQVTGQERYGVWQAFSLMCSTGVLLAGAWIARMLFPCDVKGRLHLMAVIAGAPPLVFNASRVSNDVLLSLLEFVWLGWLLCFWTRCDRRSWIGLSVITGLALLTKANALILVPISVACLFFLSQIETRWKWRAATAMFVVVGAFAGWYYAGRVGCETGVDSFVVGNIHHLNPKGHIDGVFARSFVFNPFKVVRYPFAEPWGARREYFLEYFFRSIFLGDSLGATYRWIARAYIVTALLAVPVVVRGLWILLGRRTGCDVPMLATSALIFGTQWLFVQVAPYTSSEDFRFSALLLVPMAYFYFSGAMTLTGKWQHVAFVLLELLILNSAIYLLEVALEG